MHVGKVGRAAIKIWTVIVFSGLWYRIPVAGDEGSVPVRLPRYWIGHHGGGPHKAVRSAIECGEPHSESSLNTAVQTGTQQVVNGLRERIARLTHKLTNRLLSNADNKCVVVSAIPRTVCADRLGASSGKSLTCATRQSRLKSQIR